MKRPHKKGKKEKEQEKNGRRTVSCIGILAARQSGRRGSPGCEREEHDGQVDGGAHSL
jgi:hypothetical protein